MSHKNIFYFILFIFPLAGAGIDIHVPSLPHIIMYFHSSQAAVQASVTMYLLGYGIGQLLVGIFSDGLGRRPMLLGGCFLYFIFSFASVYVDTMQGFLWTRLFQGIAVAGPAVVAKACIGDCYKGKELQVVTAYASISWALGPILAPMIGGYLQFYFHWHACFMFLAGYSLLIFVFAGLFLPETKQGESSLHMRSVLKNIIKVLSHPVMVAGMMIVGIVYAIMAVFNVMGPFIIQTSLHYSSIQYGHIALLLGLAWFVGGLVNRSLSNHYEAHTILSKGLLAATLVILISLCVSILLPFELWVVLVPLLIVYVLGGVLLPASFSIYLPLYPELGGTVNAVSGLSQMIVSALLTMIATQLVTATQLPLLTLLLAMLILSCLLYFGLTRRTASAD